MSKLESAKKILLSEAGLTLLLMKIRGVTLLIKFISTIFIAHYLGFEALGLYGLITAATIVVPSVTGLGIMFVICRRAVTRPLEEITSDIKNYIKFMFILHTPLLVVGLIYGFFTNQINLTLLIFLIIVFEHVNSCIYQLQHNLSKPIAANVIHFIRSSLWFLAYMPIAYFYEYFRTMEALLVFWNLGLLIAVMIFAISVWEWPWSNAPNRPKKLISWVLEEFKLSHKSYYNALLEAPSTYLDRYLITYFLGLETTGIYVFYWSIISAMNNLIRTGVLQTARPKIVKAFINKDENYKKIFYSAIKHSVLSSFFMSVFSIVSLYLIFPYMDNKLLSSNMPIYLIMAVAFIFSMGAEASRLKFYSQHRDDLTLRVSLFTLATSMTVNLTLIPLLGLWGASLSLLIISIVNCILQYYYLRQLR